MGITVAEKEHWKERLAQRIDLRIDSLVSKGEPGFMADVEIKSLKRTKEKLGVAEELSEAQKLERQAEELSQQSRKIREEVYRKLKGLSPECYVNIFQVGSSIQHILEQNAKLERRRVLEESELGRKVLELELKRETLVDSVWLATAPKQISDLWDSIESLTDES